MKRTTVLGCAALGLGCAAPQDPPGGPPDFTPPVLLSVSPDSGSLLTDLDARVRFEFNEVIAERGLTSLVTVSPRHDRVSVRWDRASLTVRPEGGWRPDVAYVVRVAPGLLDLRNNRLPTGLSTVFSTGTGFPTTMVQGVVVDWEAGRRAVGGLIEAIRPTDSLTYTAETDSSGVFHLPYLGAGPWVVIATLDQDRNRRRGRREAFDSTEVALGPADTVALVLWAVNRDSAGPVLREARREDSLTVRLTFSAPLHTDAPMPGAVRALLLPDSVPIAVDTVLTAPQWDARATSAPPDTTPPLREPAPRGDSTASAVDSVLTLRPALFSTWYARLAAPLRPGSRYLFDVTASNPGGARGTSRVVLAVPDTATTQ